MGNIEQMKNVLTKHLKAFSAGDWKAYKALMKDDAIYEEEATGRRVQGGDAIQQAVGPSQP